MPQSKITVKFQTTIPKQVRQKLDLRPSDMLRWEVADGGARVMPTRRGFLERRGSISVGPGSAVDDVRRARALRGKEGA